MIDKLKTWLLAILSAVAGFFYIKSRTASQAKQRVEKALEAEKQTTETVTKHAEKTRQAVAENQAARAEAAKGLETKRRNHFEKGL